MDKPDCVCVCVGDSRNVFDPGLQERWDISLAHPIQAAVETVWRPMRLFYLFFLEQQGGGDDRGDDFTAQILKVLKPKAPSNILMHVFFSGIISVFWFEPTFTTFFHKDFSSHYL